LVENDCLPPKLRQEEAQGYKLRANVLIQDNQSAINWKRMGGAARANALDIWIFDCFMLPTKLKKA